MLKFLTVWCVASTAREPPCARAPLRPAPSPDADGRGHHSSQSSLWPSLCVLPVILRCAFWAQGHLSKTVPTPSVPFLFLASLGLGYLLEQIFAHYDSPLVYRRLVRPPRVRLKQRLTAGTIQRGGLCWVGSKPASRCGDQWSGVEGMSIC